MHFIPSNSYANTVCLPGFCPCSLSFIQFYNLSDNSFYISAFTAMISNAKFSIRTVWEWASVKGLLVEAADNGLSKKSNLSLSRSALILWPELSIICRLNQQSFYRGSPSNKWSFGPVGNPHCSPARCPPPAFPLCPPVANPHRLAASRSSPAFPLPSPVANPRHLAASRPPRVSRLPSPVALLPQISWALPRVGLLTTNLRLCHHHMLGTPKMI